MSGHEVDDALLDVGPDRRVGLRARGGQLAGGLAEVGEIRDRDDDPKVPLLGRGRLDDFDRSTPGQIARDFVDRPDGGGQADPLRRLIQDRIEPLQAECEVGPPFGAGQGMDLVDDDRLDSGESLAGLTGEQQKSDSGVVMRTSLGRRANSRLSSAGVSPDRTATVMSGSGSPRRPAACRMPMSGLRRLRSTSTASAFIGET